MDLSWDVIARFGGRADYELPREFFDDLVMVRWLMEGWPQINALYQSPSWYQSGCAYEYLLARRAMLLKVAEDECRHFLLLESRLKELGSHYGALPAHDGLWESASHTSHRQGDICTLPLGGYIHLRDLYLYFPH